MRRHRLSNVPSPRLMSTIGATALDGPEAVAELVANCLDARLDNRPVHVDVQIGARSIVVADDAAGMTLEVLEQAVRLGVDMDSVTHRPGRRMGTYGLGMKTAAASLGDRWGIVTRPAVSPGVEYRVTFDLTKYVGKGAASEDWSIEVEEVERDLSGPLGGRPHGTVVWIEGLRSRDPLPGPYLVHLGQAFGPYVENSGDSLYVNGDVARQAEPDFVDGSRYELDVLVGDWKVTGWVALDKKTHNRGDYGLHLYRMGQLIETWDKSFFKAHLMTSRIVGIAHLDFVPVNFNKKGFDISSEEWVLTRPAMVEALKPAVEGSRLMSRGRGDDSRQHRALTRMRQMLGYPDGSGPPSGVAPVPPREGDTPRPSTGHTSDGGAPRTDPVRPPTSASGARMILGEHEVAIACTVMELDSRMLPWDYVYDAGDQELLVVLNPSSAVFEKTSDPEFLATFAVADCIARFLIERERHEPSKARQVRDKWLHDAFALGSRVVPDVSVSDDERVRP